MSGHTPGPWKIEGPLPDALSVVIGDNPGDWLFIADVHTGETEDDDAPYVSVSQGRANAALISAAPDLADALAGLLERHGQFIHDLPGERGLADLEAARAALRKAGRLK